MKKNSIAVVGVSHDPDKYGHKIFVDLLESRYKVWGINPKGGQVVGKTLYASLKDLPEKPDMVVTVVPPQITQQVVEQCHQLGVAHIWMQPGSESEAALQKAKDYGIDVTSQACFMKQAGIW